MPTVGLPPSRSAYGAARSTAGARQAAWASHTARSMGALFGLIARGQDQDQWATQEQGLRVPSSPLLVPGEGARSGSRPEANLSHLPLDPLGLLRIAAVGAMVCRLGLDRLLSARPGAASAPLNACGAAITVQGRAMGAPPWRAAGARPSGGRLRRPRPWPCGARRPR